MFYYEIYVIFPQFFLFFRFWFFSFIFISWRLYLLYNIVVVFVIHWHESAMDLHVFPIPIHPPTSLSTLWVFPVHQARALVSCIQPGLVICFTIDNIHISMLFSWNIPPSPSPTESKSLFCTSVSLFLFCNFFLFLQLRLLEEGCWIKGYENLMILLFFYLFLIEG